MKAGTTISYGVTESVLDLDDSVPWEGCLTSLESISLSGKIELNLTYLIYVDVSKAHIWENAPEFARNIGSFLG